jgi:hypothetical protein
VGENNRTVLGSCLKYDDNVVYIRARTQEEYDFMLVFFTGFGMGFVAEKHGKGPRHHSCQQGDKVFEIYPPRKDDESFDS